MKPALPLAILAAAGLAAAAVANDSTAEQAAGGLVLKQSDSIDMVSEDLYVSAEQIRVRYVFRNRTARDVRTIVAFPMPDRNLAELAESDSAFPSDFATSANGRPVTMQVERRAMLGTTDHSALLRRARCPSSATASTPSRPSASSASSASGWPKRPNGTRAAACAGICCRSGR
jgi:hypothetical protein